jgi:hypothetical protein
MGSSPDGDAVKISGGKQSGAVKGHVLGSVTTHVYSDRNLYICGMVYGWIKCPKAQHAAHLNT